MSRKKGLTSRSSGGDSRQRKPVRNIYFSSAGQTALSAPNAEGLDVTSAWTPGICLQALPSAKLGYSREGPAPHPSPVDGVVLGGLFGRPG